MKITYKVTVTNPVKDVLKITNDLDATGEFKVARGKTGFNITGSYIDEQVETKAYGSSFLGETYSLNEKSKLQLGLEDYNLTDIVEIFESLNKSINSPEFLKIRKGLKLIIDSKIDKFVEKSSDVFLVKIDKNGLVSKLNGIIKPFSNTLVLNETVDSTFVLAYFLISKPLKIDTDESLYISNEDILKLPLGFCKISNNLAYKFDNSVISRGDYFEFSTNKKDMITLSSAVLIDGVRALKYKIRENEKILIETLEDYITLSFNNIVDNITLVYEVLPDNSLNPAFALVGKNVDLEYSSDTELYDQLKQADEEFLKKYVTREYKILLKTTNNEHTIINSDVLKVLTDTSDFEGKILKI